MGTSIFYYQEKVSKYLEEENKHEPCGVRLEMEVLEYQFPWFYRLMHS